MRGFRLTYVDLGIAACGLLVGIAAFVHDIGADDGDPASRRQEAPGGVNLGDGGHVGQVIINNYAKGNEPPSLDNIEQRENSYLNGVLTVAPLECLRRDDSFQCNLKVTANKSGTLGSVSV